ncbi:MAG TPA: autotransporter-associated beta strand repeat-containing protein, partial [Candidatus Acidoferrum sp.]|nr:autotransporter-associated beta strand repeat-containing protein [Candidatus Acidoferrum sp.]
TNGSTLTIGGGGCLGVSAGATNYAGNITNYGIFNYASSAAQTLSGLVSGNGTLAASGPGKLTLRSANTYTGPTVITNNGTLVLASGGSINSTPSIAIAAGSTFDTSAYSTYSLVGGITLNASGTGTAAGSTAAAIQGATTATITLNGPLALTYTPTSFSGDATHPALFISGISQGQLVLVNNAFTVNNAGASPLGAGTYSLIQVAAGGTISAGAPTVTVTGHGLAAGATASIAITGNSVNLVVSGGASVPGINSITLSGTNFIFSGTNGPNSGTYYVLATTNVTLPLSNWPVIETNSFSPTGTFIVTNAVGATPWQFFSLRVVP